MLQNYQQNYKEENMVQSLQNVKTIQPFTSPRAIAKPVPIAYVHPVTVQYAQEDVKRTRALPRQENISQ